MISLAKAVIPVLGCAMWILSWATTIGALAIQALGVGIAVWCVFRKGV